jgi:hypothetical protein
VRNLDNGVIYIENPSDPENALTLYRTKSDELAISVSEERAVDSYNATFECTLYVSPREARIIRDYLIKWFPDDEATP